MALSFGISLPCSRRISAENDRFCHKHARMLRYTPSAAISSRGCGTPSATNTLKRCRRVWPFCNFFLVFFAPSCLCVTLLSWFFTSWHVAPRTLRRFGDNSAKRCEICEIVQRHLPSLSPNCGNIGASLPNSRRFIYLNRCGGNFAFHTATRTRNCF
jgi:hypothetical protein